VIVARAVDSEGEPGGGTAAITISRLARRVTSLPDFSLRLSPTGQAINPGESTKFQVYLTWLNGCDDPVSLSVVPGIAVNGLGLMAAACFWLTEG
jgi:hypothetical protein